MAFFLCPAIIFLFLGLMYFPGASKKHWCPCWSSKHTFFYVTLQIIKAPIIWLLIAVTDGRFLACFVVAVSRYTLDREFYLYVFQTTGVLAITLLVILSYVYSKLPCDCFSENKRTYRVLHHVETILDKEKHEKQQAEDKQKFLEGLHKTGEFKYRRLPKYMLDARHLLNSKLKKCSTAEPHEGGHGEHEEGKDEKHEEGEDEKHNKGNDEKHNEGEDEKHKEGKDEKHKEGKDEKYNKGNDEKHNEGEHEKHKEGEDGKHKEGENKKHKVEKDKKHKEGKDEKHKEGKDEKHLKEEDWKYKEGEDGKTVQYPPPDYLP
ncbi:high mobility group nucleosome-binding domain-containing protein 5-like isoform X2 [Hyperolius riggenbachi]